MKKNYFSVIVLMIISIISIVVSILLILDENKPNVYYFIFMLPLSFSIISLIFYKIYKEIIINLGVTLIVVLLFVRMVISPLVMYLGEYSVIIDCSSIFNMNFSIFLMIYELLSIFFMLYYQMYNIKRNRLKKRESVIVDRIRVYRRYRVCLLLIISILIICLLIVPQIITSYRTIFDINSKFFTNFEDSQIITSYGINFLKKFVIVTGLYLMRALILIFPAFIIVKLAEKKNMISRFICFFSCFFPLLFIGGAIANSLINIICLFSLYNIMLNKEKASKRMVILLAIGGLLSLFWWFIWAYGDVNFYKQMSIQFSSYFSGVNVVSGVFNLPQELKYKIRYFIYDFTSTMPYGNTIFGISHEPVHSFFNKYNNSSGQIPPTIGMSYYYIGPIFAPIYSAIFTTVVYKSGRKLTLDLGNPLKYIRLLKTIFVFSMGIVMYNIEITMTTFFSLLLPMYILEKLTNKEIKKNDT